MLVFQDKGTLKAIEAKGSQTMSLAKHVIPLTQLKSRQDAFDVAMQVRDEGLRN